jgi:hypothetical protein
MSDPLRFHEVVTQFDEDGISVRDLDNLLKRDESKKVITVDNYAAKYNASVIRNSA